MLSTQISAMLSTQISAMLSTQISAKYNDHLSSIRTMPLENLAADVYDCRRLDILSPKPHPTNCHKHHLCRTSNCRGYRRQGAKSYEGLRPCLLLLITILTQQCRPRGEPFGGAPRSGRHNCRRSYMAAVVLHWVKCSWQQWC